jgi:aminoglycoside phosphotransferase (APT) family kinase protein
VLEPEQMPERLAAFLSAHEPSIDAIEVHGYEAMTGGYSRLLARADVRWEREGRPESHTFVLRGDPPPDKQLIQTSRTVEWDVLHAVAHSVPVSTPRYIDRDGTALGTPTIVLEFLDAESLLPYLVASDEAASAAVAPRLAEAAAGFHSIPLNRLPSSLARPTSWDSYLGGRVDEWRATAAAHVEELPIMRYVGAWLDAHRPEPVPLSLIHGDFQSSNLMRRPDGTLVVLDWELAQIGDPREDLGYFKAVAQAAPPDVIALNEAGFCDRYRELTGMTEAQCSPAVIAYFLILGVIGTVRQLAAGVSGYANGTNKNLASLFNGNALQFGQMMWLQVSEQLEAAFAAVKEA